MNVITTLREKQKEKQIKYDRKILRELSIETLKNRVKEFFSSDGMNGPYFMDVLEESCFDVAIEAFLLGANYSKFGHYGESVETARYRCSIEEKHLTDTLFNFILYWGKVGDNDMYNESLYYRCEAYVGAWWLEGFEKGEKRRKMRLH
ncbi:DUF2521 family protein [Peribacillus cavernae]|uniref:DUF2521 family protein n=1 Tax=Peribacillus cavernae TaxID=1674310 RepID=A0A433H7A1_9BACI|nr:YbaK family protein [Peribacillus cavernae]MDQ0220608.1 hypothetical protein [Peribacillus cavernae]RUQ24152.1 DUF2521 family protein [Peribacillus cavernae]